MYVCLHPKAFIQIHMLYIPQLVLFSLNSPNCISFFFFFNLKI